MRVAGAIDIGGTATKLGIVGEDGGVLTRTAIPTPSAGEPVSLVENIVNALQPMLRASAEKGLPASGVGVAVAGFLDHAHTTMFGNANLPALCGFPLRAALVQGLGLECKLEVDSNAALIAEYRHGVGRGAKRLLGVTIGTGLGGAMMVGGALLRFTGECAGDVGHVILDPKGRHCTCGARGCLEAMVCSAALSERAGDRTVREIVMRAHGREQLALDALDLTGRWLGVGLASLSPLFAPDRIVVGGGVAAAGDLLLEPARDSFRAHAAMEFRDTVEIVGSRLDGWEGMIGSASAFLDSPA